MADPPVAKHSVAPVFITLRPSNSSLRQTFTMMRRASRPRDEYAEYISSPPTPCDKHLEWWAAHRDEYPRLSKMALDLFSIPMMSAECERVFSSAKNLITERRNGLKQGSQ